MYNRNESVTIIRSKRNTTELSNQNVTITINGGSACNRTKRKFIVWALVLLQLSFFWCFWFFQLGISRDVRHTNKYRQKTEPIQVMSLGHRINFIDGNSKSAAKENDEYGIETGFKGTNVNTKSFKKDFYTTNFKRLINETHVMSINDTSIWCFREGTVNKTTNFNYIRDVSKEDIFVNTCLCRTDWHGKDCGQPEVIWRTLLTSKYPMQLQLPIGKLTPIHKLIYMLDGDFLSIDFLELQIKAVSDVVDYFIINVSNKKTVRSELKSITRRLREILKHGQYFFNHYKKLQVSYVNASKIGTSLQAYKFIKNLWQNIQPTDIFIYTNDHVILNSRALKFVKYYYKTDADFATAMSFRLKYVVYGFYWQHPEKTLISGLMSSFATLENPNGGNGDPHLLLQKVEVHKIPTIIIGDLNHFGGWFCKYCFHPEDIIREINIVSNTSSHVHFPIGSRKQQIDINYIQKLIAQGLHIDGKLELIKLRRYTDKYYAPISAESCNWKYSNLLVNFYVSLEEEIEDEGVY